MRIENKKVTFDYTLLDRFEAGIALTGGEVKSVRSGRAKLDASYVRFSGSGMILVNAEILAYNFARPEGFDPKRSRQLLLHKSQMLALKHRMDGSNLTVVPVCLYTKGPRIKLEIALARGRKQFEKREIMKKRDSVRELEQEFRGKVR